MTDKKTEQPSVTGKLSFTKEEIAIMRMIFMYKSLKPTQQGLEQFLPEKGDELTAMLTFKELKKAQKENDK